VRSEQVFLVWCCSLVVLHMLSVCVWQQKNLVLFASQVFLRGGLVMDLRLDSSEEVLTEAMNNRMRETRGFRQV
jgi:hypothetical protein